MSEPTTEAGKRLIDDLVSYVLVPGRPDLSERIVDIEQEARRDTLAKVRAAVEGLIDPSSRAYDQMTRAGALRALLAILDEMEP